MLGLAPQALVMVVVVRGTGVHWFVKLAAQFRVQSAHEYQDTSDLLGSPNTPGGDVNNC